MNRLVAGLDEKQRRRVVGLLAMQWGHGGIERLMKITGMSRNTICRGRAEIQVPDGVPQGRVRRVGGGRKEVKKNSPRL